MSKYESLVKRLNINKSASNLKRLMNQSAKAGMPLEHLPFKNTINKINKPFANAPSKATAKAAPAPVTKRPAEPTTKAPATESARGAASAAKDVKYAPKKDAAGQALEKAKGIKDAPEQSATSSFFDDVANKADEKAGRSANRKASVRSVLDKILGTSAKTIDKLNPVSEANSARRKVKGEGQQILEGTMKNPGTRAELGSAQYGWGGFKSPKGVSDKATTKLKDTHKKLVQKYVESGNYSPKQAVKIANKQITKTLQGKRTLRKGALVGSAAGLGANEAFSRIQGTDDLIDDAMNFDTAPNTQTETSTSLDTAAGPEKAYNGILPNASNFNAGATGEEGKGMWEQAKDKGSELLDSTKDKGSELLEKIKGSGILDKLKALPESQGGSAGLGALAGGLGAYGATSALEGDDENLSEEEIAERKKRKMLYSVLGSLAGGGLGAGIHRYKQASEEHLTLTGMMRKEAASLSDDELTERIHWMKILDGDLSKEASEVKEQLKMQLTACKAAGLF